MEHMNADRLIERIKQASALTGMTPATLCQYGIRNSRFFQNLLDGKDFQHGTATRLLKYLDGLSSADIDNSAGESAAGQPDQKSQKSPEQSVSTSETGVRP
jgi:hypothetical protein